jgi:hypothetical protein
MLGSRLFHTVVIVGAALVAGPMMVCSGDDGSPSTGSTTTPSTETNATNPDPSGDAGADTGSDADPGWAPTK